LQIHCLEEILEGEKATEELGRRLAPLLRPGDVVALYGELGSGKTCLVRGLAQGLGVKEGEVSSPSFTLINEYDGPIPFYHIDCYRLQLREEIRELGLEDYLEGHGVSAVEWAERIEDLPEVRLDIFFEILDEHRRRVVLKAGAEIAGRIGWGYRT